MKALNKFSHIVADICCLSVVLLEQVLVSFYNPAGGPQQGPQGCQVHPAGSAGHLLLDVTTWTLLVFLLAVHHREVTVISCGVLN